MWQKPWQVKNFFSSTILLLTQFFPLNIRSKTLPDKNLLFLAGEWQTTGGQYCIDKCQYHDDEYYFYWCHVSDPAQVYSDGKKYFFKSRKINLNSFFFSKIEKILILQNFTRYCCVLVEQYWKQPRHKTKMGLLYPIWIGSRSWTREVRFLKKKTGQGWKGFSVQSKAAQ